MKTATSIFARTRSWLRAVTSRSRLEQEIDAELAFHLESYIEDLERQGIPHDEAMRRAKIEFGGVTVHKEEMRASLGLRLWDDLRADVRYAFRMLCKTPVFTVIAVGSLALGIGANTAIFTLAKEMLLDRLHVPQPGELRLLHWRAPKNSAVHSVWGDVDETENEQSDSFSYQVYRDLREQNRKQGVLGDLFAFKDLSQVTATVDGQAQIVRAEMVSGNYYRELQVNTVLGRSISPEDDAVEGAGAVIVISDGFWRRAFAASQNVIGKTIAINGKPFTIIGVNPPGFTGAKGAHQSPQVFLPFSIQPVIIPMRKGSILDEATFWWMQIMARQKAGISKERAEAALNAALTASMHGLHNAKPGEALPKILMEDGSRGENEAARRYRQPVTVLMVVAGLVLLLACANLANLLLARASAREREMAVRLALGAGRGRILRQVLTESLLLSFAGGVAGFALGWASRDVIPKLMSQPWDPTQLSSRVDWGVLTFTAGLSLVTGLLFGLAPALRATRTQASSDLKDNTTTVTRRRTGYAGKAIVVFQVALSTLLVIGAGLFLRTLENLNHVSPGFRVDHLLLFEIDPPRAAYPPPSDVRLHEEIAQRLAVVPGVESVTASSGPLLAGQINRYDWQPFDNPITQSKDARRTNFVGNHFFSTMEIPLVAGRDFREGDSASAEKVGIINESLARQAWGKANPLGRHFKTDFETYTIVGVVKDSAYDSLRKTAPPQFFLGYRQLPETEDGLTYEVRTHVSAASLAPSLQKAVAEIDRNLPLMAVRTQQQQIDATVGDERMFAGLTAGFGLLALALATIGIYGVMAYNVARRTHEIGIRRALGAQTKQVLGMILSEASWLALTGVTLGIGTALTLTRLLRSMLFEVKPNDPVTMLSAALLLLAIGLLAGFMPARRATRIEPMQALRHQ